MLVLGGVSKVPGLMLRMWACGKMFNFNWRPTSRMSNWVVDEELDMGNSEICGKKEMSRTEALWCFGRFTLLLSAIIFGGVRSGY